MKNLTFKYLQYMSMNDRKKDSYLFMPLPAQVVKGSSPRVYPENEEFNKDELCQTPTTLTPDSPDLKDRGTPYRRHRSASESDILSVEKVKQRKGFRESFKIINFALSEIENC